MPMFAAASTTMKTKPGKFDVKVVMMMMMVV